MAEAIADSAARPFDRPSRCLARATFGAVAALLFLLAVFPIAYAQVAPDAESEPDLAGLLAATGRMRMAEIEPGLSVGLAEYAPYGVRIHVFDFDQRRYSLAVAEQSSAKGSRAPEFLGGGDDVFAINGGFFERSRSGKLSPSGLVISNGNMTGREHDRAGSGVIYSGPDGVAIAYRKNFSKTSIDQALQVGPILVDPGGVKGIYKNVGGRFNRSAVCLRGRSFTAFVVEGGLSLFQFADLLSLPKSRGGFGCDVAINLDGGPSTQAVLRAGPNRRDILGETTVQNALVVSRKR